MGEKVKNYLKEMALNNDGNMFLFNQFYLHPDIILGGEDESTIEEYYKYGRIKDLLLSYKIFEFMLLCISDKKFRKRIDGRENLARKMGFMAYDFLECRNHYIEDFNNESFIRVLNSEEPIGKWKEKYNILEISLLVDYYKKYGWIYNIGLEHAKTLKVSDKLIGKLQKELDNWSWVYYEEYIEPKRLEDGFISALDKGNYYEVINIANFYMDNPEFMDKKTFKALMCSNKLLVLCKRKLLRRNLSFNVMEKIVFLIDVSIDLHEENFEEDSTFEWYYNMVGKKRVSEYDVDLAKTIVDKFDEKVKNTKVLKLY